MRKAGRTRRDNEAREVEKIADALIERHLAPRLREIHASQRHSPVTPGQVAMAAAAVKEGSWTEKDVKKHFDRMFDNVPGKRG